MHVYASSFITNNTRAVPWQQPVTYFTQLIRHTSMQTRHAYSSWNQVRGKCAQSFEAYMLAALRASRSVCWLLNVFSCPALFLVKSSEYQLSWRVHNSGTRKVLIDARAFNISSIKHGGANPKTRTTCTSVHILAFRYLLGIEGCRAQFDGTYFYVRACTDVSVIYFNYLYDTMQVLWVYLCVPLNRLALTKQAQNGRRDTPPPSPPSFRRGLVFIVVRPTDYQRTLLVFWKHTFRCFQ